MTPSAIELRDKEEELARQVAEKYFEEMFSEIAVIPAVRMAYFEALSTGDRLNFADVVMRELDNYARNTGEFRREMDDWLSWGYAEECDAARGDYLYDRWRDKQLETEGQ